MGSDEFIGKKSLKNLIDRLIGTAFMHSQCGCPQEPNQRSQREKGEPFDYWTKPGYLEHMLKTDEERELIKTCTEKDFNHRVFK